MKPRSTSPRPVPVPSFVLGALALLLPGLPGCGRGGGGDDGGSAPRLSIASASVMEGSGGGTTNLELEVTLAPAASQTVTVRWATSDLTAFASGDYVADTGILAFAPGETSKPVVIRVEADGALEPDETLRISLNQVTGGAVLGVAQATGTILNDDLPRLDIDSQTVTEGDAGTRSVDLVVSLEAAASSDVHVDYAIGSGTATDGVDFTGFPGTRTLTIPQGSIGENISVDVLGDTTPEPDETFTVVLSGLVGEAVLGNGVGTATIEDDDGDGPPDLPRVGVSARATVEGDAGTSTTLVFTVEVAPPAASDLIVDYETVDGSALAGSDYTATSGSVIVPAGSAGQTFAVDVLGDADVEPLETFLVDLRLAFGQAKLVTPSTRGYVVDDDAPPGVPDVTLANAVVFEGDAGTLEAELEVTLSEPIATAVVVDFATRDDTALAGSDYEPSAGTLVIPAGEVLGVVTARVLGDTVTELDERFLVELSNLSSNANLVAGLAVVTVLTDDPLARIAVPAVGVVEGDPGDANELVFAVTIDRPTADPVRFTYETLDDTATAGVDYVYTTGQLELAAGDTSGEIRVPVLADLDNENDERLVLELRTPTLNATIDDPAPRGTIQNDDGDGGWRGAELVHEGTETGGRLALRPQVAFAPTGELHVVFNQEASGFGYDVLGRVSPGPGVWNAFESLGTTTAYELCQIEVDAVGDAVAIWVDENEELLANRYTNGAGWDTPTSLAPGEVQGEPRLAMNAATGEAFAVWQESLSTSADGFHSIRYARFLPGQGWIESDYLENQPEHTGYPLVEVGPNGEALVVFPQYDVAAVHQDLLAFRYVAGAWTGPERLDDGAGVTSPGSLDLAMDAAGNAAVSWRQESSGLATLSPWVSVFDASTGTWSTPYEADEQNVFVTATPNVALDGLGNAFVTWVQQSPVAEDLWVNRLDAATATWSGPVLLEFDDAVKFGAILSPEVAADDLGNAIVTWTQDDGARRNLRAARYSFTDAAWGPEELLESFTDGDANASYLALDRATGDAVVVWHHARPDPVIGFFTVTDIYANRYDAP